MQSLCIGKCRKDIQLFNTYFFIMFIHILFFTLALANRCANFAASSLYTKAINNSVMITLVNCKVRDEGDSRSQWSLQHEPIESRWIDGEARLVQNTHAQRGFLFSRSMCASATGLFSSHSIIGYFVGILLEALIVFIRCIYVLQNSVFRKASKKKSILVRGGGSNWWKKSLFLRIFSKAIV